MIHTDKIGKVLPDLSTEFGTGKKIDINFSPSHKFFQEGFPDAAMTNMHIDANGDWRVQLNLPL